MVEKINDDPSTSSLTILNSLPGLTDPGGDWADGSVSVASNITLPQSRQERIEVGFSTVKRFNFLVVGVNGSGKTSFSMSALKRYFHDIKMNPVNGPTSAIEERGRCEKIQDSTQIIVTIVDTPGFGDTVNNNDRIVPIINYIRTQNRKYEDDEGYRTPNHQGSDTRIHCCFYFIMPHRLTPLDIEFMTKLQDKVPLVPIVAKADTMTTPENEQHLYNVHQTLKNHKIGIFDFKENDIDGSWLENFIANKAEIDSVAQEGEVSAASTSTCLAKRRQIPNVFAVITGKREYPWGIATETDEDHSDTPRLHRVLFTSSSLQSLGRLQDRANRIHEEWRSTRSAQEELRQRLKVEERRASLVRLVQVAVLVVLYSVLWYARMDRLEDQMKGLRGFLDVVSWVLRFFADVVLFSLGIGYLLTRKTV